MFILNLAYYPLRMYCFSGFKVVIVMIVSNEIVRTSFFVSGDFHITKYYKDVSKFKTHENLSCINSIFTQFLTKKN